MALSLTPGQRKLRARAAAFALHAQGGTTTKAATAAFLDKFEREVDPAGVLDPAERVRRAQYARKSYMAALSLKASRARGRKAKPEDRLEIATRELLAAAGVGDV